MRQLITILISTITIFSCTKEKIELLNPTDFATTLDGKETALYTLKNDNGMVVQFTNYGARIVSIWVPDREGKYRDVLLGFESIDDYLNSKVIYSGPIVGRFGNRIKDGKFSLNGKDYQLSINNNDNHLHGGTGGSECKVWDAEMIKREGKEILKMSYLFKDGEEGYPGNFQTEVYYELTDDNALKIDIRGTTDAPTIVNIITHGFFNLTGSTNNTILDHQMQINASRYTPTDDELIPTGEINSIVNTPLDFRNAKAIGRDINLDFQALHFGLGYDHNFILDKKEKELSEAVVVSSPTSGIQMTVLTDQPAIQFYSGNFMDGTVIGKNNEAFIHRSCFALEPQIFPDAPNHANFPSAVLNPGETYTQTTIYKFSTIE